MTDPLDAGTWPHVEQAYAARWQPTIRHDLAWREGRAAWQTMLRKSEPPAGVK